MPIPVSRRPIYFLALGCSLLCSLVYRGLQRWILFPIENRPDCWSWQWVPFNSWWVLPYALMFVFIAAAWITVPDFPAAKRFAKYLVGSATVAWLFFVFYPTACTRPPSEHGNFLWKIVLLLDGPTNAFPCLHATFGILTTTAIFHHLRLTARHLLSWILLTGLFLMFISILALRQHTGIDIVAGSVVALVAAWGYVARVPNLLPSPGTLEVPAGPVNPATPGESPAR